MYSEALNAGLNGFFRGRALREAEQDRQRSREASDAAARRAESDYQYRVGLRPMQEEAFRTKAEMDRLNLDNARTSQKEHDEDRAYTLGQHTLNNKKSKLGVDAAQLTLDKAHRIADQEGVKQSMRYLLANEPELAMKEYNKYGVHRVSDIKKYQGSDGKDYWYATGADGKGYNIDPTAVLDSLSVKPAGKTGKTAMVNNLDYVARYITGGDKQKAFNLINKSKTSKTESEIKLELFKAIAAKDTFSEPAEIRKRVDDAYNYVSGQTPKRNQKTVSAYIAFARDKGFPDSLIEQNIAKYLKSGALTDDRKPGDNEAVEPAPDNEAAETGKQSSSGGGDLGIDRFVDTPKKAVLSPKQRATGDLNTQMAMAHTRITRATKSGQYPAPSDVVEARKLAELGGDKRYLKYLDALVASRPDLYKDIIATGSQNGQ